MLPLHATHDLHAGIWQQLMPIFCLENGSSRSIAKLRPFCNPEHFGGRTLRIGTTFLGTPVFFVMLSMSKHVLRIFLVKPLGNSEPDWWCAGRTPQDSERQEAERRSSRQAAEAAKPPPHLGCVRLPRAKTSWFKGAGRLEASGIGYGLLGVSSHAGENLLPSTRSQACVVLLVEAWICTKTFKKKNQASSVNSC